MTRATKYWAWMAVYLGVAMATPTAQAALMMRLSTDDSSWTTITDNLGSDLNATTGSIVFSGGVGSTFNVNVTTGLSKPALAGPAAHMDLNSINIATAGAGLLYIELTDTDWAWGDQATAQLNVGGVLTAPAGSTISHSAWYDPDNLPFDREQSLASAGPFGPGAYAGTTTSAGLAADAAGSLTLRTVIDMTGNGTASFDSDLKVNNAVPEPASWALAVLALAGLAGSRARRRT